MSYRIISTPESRAAETAAKATAEAAKAAQPSNDSSAPPQHAAPTQPEAASTPRQDATAQQPSPATPQSEHEEFMARIEASYAPTTEAEKFVAHQIANVMWRMKWLEQMELDALLHSEAPFLEDHEFVGKNVERIEKLRQCMDRSYARWTREWRALKTEVRRDREQQLKAQQVHQKAVQQAIERRMHDYIFAPLPVEPGHPSTRVEQEPARATSSTVKNNSPISSTRPSHSAPPRFSPTASKPQPPSLAQRP